MITKIRKSTPYERFQKKRNTPALWNCNDYVCFFAEKYQERNIYPYSPDYGKETIHMQKLMTYCKRRSFNLQFLLAWIFKSGQRYKEVSGLNIMDIDFDFVKRYEATAYEWAKTYIRRIRMERAKQNYVPIEKIADMFEGKIHSEGGASSG